MLTTKPNAQHFMATPEMRIALYKFCDKKTLSRLASTCKTVNNEINPSVDGLELEQSSTQKKTSPWTARRELDYPGLKTPTDGEPKSARWHYRAAEIAASEDARPVDAIVFESHHEWSQQLGQMLAPLNGIIFTPEPFGAFPSDEEQLKTFILGKLRNAK